MEKNPSIDSSLDFLELSTSGQPMVDIEQLKKMLAAGGGNPEKMSDTQTVEGFKMKTMRRWSGTQQIYVGSLTVVGLFVLYRILQKSY